MESPNISNMLSQNQGDEEGICAGLKTVVGHIFGKHRFFQESWCGYLKNPGTFKHKNIPCGRDLQNKDLETALNKIFIDGLSHQLSKLAKHLMQ